jgi:ABC-type lipoprotein export system ATPase subunit
MTKICDLVNFEKIKDVIDIDALGDEESKKGLVEKYLISSAIEDHLVDLCNDFASETHKAAQIIGGYGSGKSHLLGLIISILSDTNLVQYIQNENVRNASKKNWP